MPGFPHGIQKKAAFDYLNLVISVHLGTMPESLIDAYRNEIVAKAIHFIRYHRKEVAAYRSGYLRPPPSAESSEEDRLMHSQDNLDSPADGSTMRAMSVKVPTWAQLKISIARLTSERGQKAALAAKFGVSRQVLGNWLSTDDQGAPNATLTLRLLRWVQEKEDEQEKSPGGAKNTTGAKTRSRKSYHENLKSSPP
jgi:hypothetical protein